MALEQARWPPLALLSRKQGPAKNSLQAGSHSRETFCIRLKKKKKNQGILFKQKSWCWRTAGSLMPETGTEQGSLSWPVVTVGCLLRLLLRQLGSLPLAPTLEASKSRPDECISQDKKATSSAAPIVASSRVQVPFQLSQKSLSLPRSRTNSLALCSQL